MTELEFQELLEEYEHAAREVGAYKGLTADGPYEHRLKPMQDLRERIIAAKVTPNPHLAYATLTDLLYAAEAQAREGQSFEYSPEDFEYLPELFAKEFPNAWHSRIPMPDESDERKRDDEG